MLKFQHRKVQFEGSLGIAGFKSGFCGLLCSQYGNPHVQAYFSEGFGIDGGVLELVKPVETVHPFQALKAEQYSQPEIYLDYLQRLC